MPTKPSQSLSSSTSISNLILTSLQNLLLVCKTVQQLCAHVSSLQPHPPTPIHKFTLSLSLSQQAQRYRPISPCPPPPPPPPQVQFPCRQLLVALCHGILSRRDYKYFEHVPLKELSQKCSEQVLSELQNILQNLRHQFYLQRSYQVQLITQVTTYIDHQAAKLKKCLMDLRVTYPQELDQYFGYVAGLVKKVRYVKQADCTLQIIVNVQDQEKGQGQQKLHWESGMAEIGEGSKQIKKHPTTNATTSARLSSVRQSATTSATRYNIAFPDPNLPTSQNRQRRFRKTQSKQKQDVADWKQRPKTAKAGYKYLIQEALPLPCEKQQFSEQSSHLHPSQLVVSPPSNPSPLQPSPAPQSGPMSSRLSRLSNSRTSIKKEERISGMSRSSKFNSASNSVNHASNGGKNTSMRHSGRHGIMHEMPIQLGEIAKAVRKVERNRNYRKSGFHRHKVSNSKMFDVEKINEEEKQAQSEQKGSRILKLPKQKIRAIVKLKLTKPKSKSNSQTRGGRNNSDMRKKVAKATPLRASPSEADPKQDSALLNAEAYEKFKEKMNQVNNLRSQFVKVRRQNHYNGAVEELEHSFFFIEQGLISRRQNMEFQVYLKELQQVKTSKPFAIESELEEMQKAIFKQRERKEAFEGESVWLKRHNNFEPQCEQHSFHGKAV